MLTKSRGAQRRCSRIMISAVENLECRVLFNTAPVVLSADGSVGLSQDWSNTALFAAGANNIWDNVPGMVGYQGQDSSTTSAPGGNLNDPSIASFQADWENNPNIAVPSSYSTPLNPNTITTGELGYFTGTNVNNNNVVAFQGSGTADYPNLLLYVDASNVSTTQSAINVSFNARDIDGSADNAVQQINTQYRIGNSGPFTNVPLGYIADATTGPSEATEVTPITCTLPITASGQSLVEIRIMTANATGNDEFVGIDDINVHAVTSPGTFVLSSSTAAVQENAGAAQFTVYRTGGIEGQVTVDYATSDGTATAGSDYTATSGTLTFAAGQDTATINIPIIDDSVPESAEDFTLKLSNPTGGATLTSTSPATITIYDNDGTAPTGILLNELDVNPPGANDGPDEYVELINSSGSSASLNDLYLISVEGDAFSNPGNVTYSGSFGTNNTLSAGQLAVLEASSGGPTVPGGAVVVTDPALNGSAGALQNGTNSFLLVYSQTPIISNTDLDPGNFGGTSAPENGTLTALPGGAVILDSVAWHDNTPANLDSGHNGTIYGKGSSVADLSIPNVVTGAATRIPGDNNANDASQWYYGALFSSTGDPTALTYDSSNVGGTFPAGGVLTPGAANYYNTITSGQIGFSSSLYTVNESVSNQGTDSGSVTITVQRVAGSTGQVLVDYAITAGTATAGLDYSTPTLSNGSTQTAGGYTGTITFAAGQTSETVTVPIFNDAIAEPSEAFTLALSNPRNPGNPGNAPLLGISNATINIGDNDTKLLLNELLVNVPGEAGDTNGSDQYNEMVEILGTPGQVIPANTYFVSVEGDSTATIGSITYALDLGGTVVGSNGLIEIRSENAASVLPPPAPGTTVIDGDSTDPVTLAANGFDQSGGVLQNGTNSFLLISSAEVLTSSSTTTLGQSNDVDTGKDGTLDLSTLGAHLIDGVGWTDGGTGDVAYGALLNFGGFAVTQSLGSPAAEIAPAAGVRVPGTTDVPDLNGNSTASLTAASDWYYGSLIGQDTTAPATDDRLVFDPNYSARFNFNNQSEYPIDSNEHLTPGELNYNTPPFVELPTTAFSTGTVNPILNLDFSSNVSQNLSTSQMTLTNTDTSSTVSGLSIASETSAQAFANGYVETVNLPTSLAQGHYTLTINSGVTDDFGLQSTQSYTVHFTVIYGDANGDGKVNALDFNTLATNYGSAGNYTKGDFDYSGMVGSNDFAILAANYGKIIPAATLSSPAAVPEALPSGTTPASSLAASSASLFSNQPISGSLVGDLLN